MWKKGKRGAALPLPFFLSPLKAACHPEPSARDLLAIDRSVFSTDILCLRHEITAIRFVAVFV